MTIFLYLILCFIYIYGPVFNSLGSWADTIFVVSFLLFLKDFVVIRNWLPTYSRIFLILFPVFIYATFLISIFPGVIPGDYLQVLLKPLRILITLLAGFSIVFSLYKRYGTESFNILVRLIFYSVVLHSLIMILQFYNKDFKDLVYSFTTIGKYRSTFEYDFRMGGLSGGTGGAVLSVVQSMGILLLPFVLKNTSKIKKILVLSLSLVIVYSILICGRSGILNVLLFLPLSLFLVHGKINVLTILKLFLITIAVVITLSFLVNYTNKTESSNPLHYALQRSLNTFINYEKTGKVKEETINILVGQIVLPPDVITFIFGNGEFIVDRGLKRTLQSDIGYIVNLWGFGVIVFIMYLVPLLIFLYVSFVYRKSYLSASLLFLVTLVMLFFHSKELFLYVRMLFSIYSLALACFFIETGSYHQRIRPSKSLS